MEEADFNKEVNNSVVIATNISHFNNECKLSKVGEMSHFANVKEDSPHIALQKNLYLNEKGYIEV